MNEIPEGAFSRCTDYMSITWEDWFPGHCYICHVANTPELPNSEHDLPAGGVCSDRCPGCQREDDTSNCGPHCEHETG